MERCECRASKPTDECRALFRSPDTCILFEYSSGILTAYVGRPHRKFPPFSQLLNRRSGWYALHKVVSAYLGRSLYTPSMLEMVRPGRLDTFQLEELVFREWFDKMWEMVFAPSGWDGWRERILEAADRVRW